MKTKSWSNRKTASVLFGTMLLSAAAALSFLLLQNSAAHELCHAYNVDAPLYWTVGRGILNGVMPYSGLYEDKPPGIFLISALSFALTDDTILCNVVCWSCLLATGLLPLISALEEVRRLPCAGEPDPFLRRASVCAAALMAGLMLMAYCQSRSGGFETESMGAAMIGLYYGSAAHIRWRNLHELGRPSQLLWTLAASVSVLCGVLMKEPFVLLAVSGGLLLAEDRRQLLTRIAVPLCLGGAAGTAAMAASGVLQPYVEIDLREMLTAHITMYGSPFVRGLNVLALAGDLRDFSPPLALLLAAALAVVLAGNFLDKTRTLRRKLLFLGAAVLSVYAASFAVGLGGQYFWHHYVFAAPLYLLLLMLAARQLLRWRTGDLLPALLAAALMACSVPLRSLAYDGDYEERYAAISEQAAYVDSLLDTLGESSYLFIGFNGEDCWYGLTRHSPAGPVFAQDSDLFQDADSWFAQSFLQELETADVVIVHDVDMPALNGTVLQTLEDDFSVLLPAEAAALSVPEGFTDTVYLRKTSGA